MIIMRFVDIMIAIPLLIWVSLFILVLTPGMGSIIVAFALAQWTDIARLTRGEVLKLKRTEFVIASSSSGASSWRLISRHFFPNVLPVIIVAVTFQVTNAFGEAFSAISGWAFSPADVRETRVDGDFEMRDNPYMLFSPRSPSP
jgi:oligopeptide transport system permease protein